ncbi:P-loop containing nucleoside triphosphate hydrolase protein [Clohesyomyces aquaticus]|uniref:p-loop containing nucleoside triphosphate hydrolase protein n=1 Tax=Clohesyomyces aquaticus TaxID=1231657 RepID=A0A1Y2ABA3_9PLEO|nr:P-loop containing nucleoside triphosphate hydrolase protein [Clohesyomyces aquaticus]
MTIECVGCSTEPIKALLDHVKKWCSARNKNTTRILRPRPTSGRDGYVWHWTAQRQSRPMSTVSLDQDQKAKITRDTNGYLHPLSSRWYAPRGIPYRRGYLFHGPPGTGKTSLSFSLAGVYGIDVYCISLMDVGLTESTLNQLLSDLPRRSAKTKGKKLNFEGKITLSGLLNVIDGAASHEGHILIMTTNRPEKLNLALIRPGRVDLQVKFALAIREQTRKFYLRMYATDRKPEKDSDDGNDGIKPILAR